MEKGTDLSDCASASRLCCRSNETANSSWEAESGDDTHRIHVFYTQEDKHRIHAFYTQEDKHRIHVHTCVHTIIFLQINIHIHKYT